MISSRFHRAGPDGGDRFGRMLGFSVFIHLILLSFFVFSTSVPSPKWTFGPVHTVQLVSLSDRMSTGTAVSSLSREILRPQPAPSAIILRKPVETRAAVPLKREEVLKKPADSIEKALAAIRDRVQSVSKPPPAAGKQAAQAEGQAAGRADAGQADTGQRMDPYYAEIWARIRGQWSLPQGILPKGNVETVINVRILRNGAVVDVGFEKRSGNGYFDDSAIRAVKKASPLPPLPSWIRGNDIEIGIRFRSDELR
ncbi:MAG: TonB family protein [Pseudomonadota bacterium]